MRIWAISDLHTDFVANWNALQQISLQDFRSDALIVAGDIADDLSVIAKTLLLLRNRFHKVCYVPGNHELWVRIDACNSIKKMERLLTLCDDIGIHTKPSVADGVWIIPMFSWYDETLDEDGSAEIKELEGWADYHFCKWPNEVHNVADYFLDLNEAHVKMYDGKVITFSHFLPRRDLMPETAFLKFKGLPRVAGCKRLDQQIRAIDSMTHVFGHSHIPHDRVIDGIRYVQTVLGYPAEGRSIQQSLWLL